MKTYEQMKAELSKMDKKERKAFIQQNLNTYNKTCYGSEAEKEEEVPSDRKTPLVHAIRKGDKEIAIALIEGGVDVNKGDPSPLHAVAFSKNENLVEVIDLLVKHKAEINKKDENYGTPLLAALHPLGEKQFNDFNDKVARKLIECKADINISDNKGNSPLIQVIYLVQQGKAKVDLAKLLIDSGAKTDVRYVSKTYLTHRDSSLYELAEEGDYPGKAELLKLLPKPDKKMEAPKTEPAPAKQPAPVVKSGQTTQPAQAIRPTQTVQPTVQPKPDTKKITDAVPGPAKPVAAGVHAKPVSPVGTNKPSAPTVPRQTAVQPGTTKPAVQSGPAKPVQPAAAPKAGTPVTLLRKQYEEQAKAKASAEKSSTPKPPTAGRKTPPPG